MDVVVVSVGIREHRLYTREPTVGTGTCQPRIRDLLVFMWPGNSTSRKQVRRIEESANRIPSDFRPASHSNRSIFE